MKKKHLFAFTLLAVLSLTPAALAQDTPTDSSTPAPAATAAAPSDASATPAPAPTDQAPAPKKGKKAKAEAATPDHPKVEIETSLGKIVLELDHAKAPISVDNFLRYVKEKHFDGTIFHRVIAGFMIQGGGYDKDLKEKPTHEPIKNESSNGLTNDEGTVAMARTPAPDSASAQFFINVKSNDFLNKDHAQDGVGYAVFGKVSKGMDVVHKIEKVETGNQNGMGDVPTKPVVIKKVKVIK